MSEMPLGGQTGLRHDDNRWLIAEAKSLREMYQAERERRRIAEQQFRELENRLYQQEQRSAA